MTQPAQPRPAPTIRRVFAQASFEFRAVIRNGEQLVLSLVLPLGIFFALALTGILDVFGYRGVDHTAVALAGVLGVSIASTAFTGQAIATAFDRRYGVLRHIATTPLGAAGLVWGKILAVLAVTACQFALLFACAGALGLTTPVSFAAVAVTGVLGTASLVSLGLLMAGTLRAEAVLAFANVLWAAMSAVGGLLIEPAGLWGRFVEFTPPGALGRGMRCAVLDGRFDLVSLAVLAVWTLVAVACARRWFSFDDR